MAEDELCRTPRVIGGGHEVRGPLLEMKSEGVWHLSTSVRMLA